MKTPASPNWVAPLTRKVMAMRVLPQPADPHSSVGRPMGSPPRVISSRPLIPVGAFSSAIVVGPPGLPVSQAFAPVSRDASCQAQTPVFRPLPALLGPGAFSGLLQQGFYEVRQRAVFPPGRHFRRRDQVRVEAKGDEFLQGRVRLACLSGVNTRLQLRFPGSDAKNERLRSRASEPEVQVETQARRVVQDRPARRSSGSRRCQNEKRTPVL
jgi:hypothetical protein